MKWWNTELITEKKAETLADELDKSCQLSQKIGDIQKHFFQKLMLKVLLSFETLLLSRLERSA